MACSDTVKTWFEGAWHDGDVRVMRAADHGAWLGTSVFDGARYAKGLTPDLRAHCDRVNRSAEALFMTPTVSTDRMVDIVMEGLARFPRDTAVYIRPMYWAIEGDQSVVAPRSGPVGFSICLEAIPLAPEAATITLCKTRFRRPTLEVAVVNAKAGCLYPNSARMLLEARARGFHNVLVTDVTGNVVETASTNIFMVRDGEIFTPIPNGTFLAGITRARVIDNFRRDGTPVHETVLGYADFEAADEIFTTGNMNKVTPVTRFEETDYQSGPVARRAREMYWDWAHSDAGDVA